LRLGITYEDGKAFLEFQTIKLGSPDFLKKLPEKESPERWPRSGSTRALANSETIADIEVNGLDGRVPQIGRTTAAVTGRDCCGFVSS
jgi:hypothetical protein